MRYLQVKNWSEYQHYKNRNPSWIKLHVNTLNDRHFAALSLASRGLLLQLWILASENKGRVPYDLEEIRFRLRDDSINKKDIKLLTEKGFLKVKTDGDSDLQADDSTCKHSQAGAFQRREEKSRLEENREEESKEPEVRQEVQDLAMQIFGHVPPNIANWVEYYDDEWILLALKKSEGKRSARYTKKILENWAKGDGPPAKELKKIEYELHPDTTESTAKFPEPEPKPSAEEAADISEYAKQFTRKRKDTDSE